MSFFKSTFTKSFVAVVLVALSLFAFSGVSSAYANTILSPASTHVSQLPAKLSHCPGKWLPYHKNSRGKVCVVTVPNGGSSSRPSIQYYYVAYVCYFENGPFGKSSWSNGWGDCVDQYGGNPYYVPRVYNDKASSWDSCVSGTFYVNQPYTTPSANYPADYNGQNFPWGAVPNDSLSSLSINGPAQQCLLLGTATTHLD